MFFTLACFECLSYSLLTDCCLLCIICCSLRLVNDGRGVLILDAGSYHCTCCVVVCCVLTCL